MNILELNKRIGHLEAVINGLLEMKHDPDDIWTQVARKAGIEALQESTFYGAEYKDKLEGETND
jgi:N-glycosylase/DNA lyase